MGFNAIENSPAALRVRWAPSCQIPYHYHPTGALYFIQYGQMFFEGDGPVPDVPINKGEVRWVRPGFAYGPEYNSNTEGTHILEGEIKEFRDLNLDLNVFFFLLQQPWKLPFLGQKVLQHFLMLQEVLIRCKKKLFLHKFMMNSDNFCRIKTCISTFIFPRVIIQDNQKYLLSVIF